MQIKELEWVDFLKKSTSFTKDVCVGIGDDCALVNAGKNKLLLKSDLFIEGIHFDRKKISFKDIGKRAVGRVLSDFAACGGVPIYIGISAGIPKNVSYDNLKEIFKGVLNFSKKYNFSLIGGDTSRAKELFLDVWGVGKTKKCILRSTAQIGDYIFLSGRLGERAFDKPFIPRIKEAKELVSNFKINSMIDISDGFALDLYRVLISSKKGALIYSDNIPTTNGETDLYRGEDYELIFTVDKNDRKINSLKKKFYFLGKIKPKGFGLKVEKKGKISNLKVKGYSHI